MSPSGTQLGAQDRPPRAGGEAGLDEEGQERRVGHGLAVEPLDRKPLAPVPARVLDEGAESTAVARLSSGSRRVTSVRPPRSTKSAASPPSRTTCAPATRAARPSAFFGQGSAAPYGCAGSAAASTSASGLFSLLRPQLTQPFDRAAERELRAAEALDEIAAPAETERLERPQLAVDGSVPSGYPLRADAVPGDDALPLEQELGQRSRTPAPRRAERATSVPASRSAS